MPLTLPSANATPIDRPLTPSLVLPGQPGTVRRARFAAETGIRSHLPATPRGALAVSAPMPHRSGHESIAFVVATERELPSFFGAIVLKCAPENVDLTRLRNGLLSLAIDHDPTKPAGRVTALTVGGGVVSGTAEIADTPRGADLYKEISDGLRIGISPGFVIHETEEVNGDGDSFTFDIRVTMWEPYEVSSTAIPRNSDALITSPRMGGFMAGEMVNTSDLISLSVAVARVAARSRSTAAHQRARLGRMLKVYDAAIAGGETRDNAVIKAKTALAE